MQETWLWGKISKYIENRSTNHIFDSCSYFSAFKFLKIEKKAGYCSSKS